MAFFRGGFFGDFDDDRTDRSGWAVKSGAAVRRETEVISLFDAFLEDQQAATNFPVTEEIAPATLHLTDPCWHTFRRHVESKGCKAKRRIATEQERGKDKRKGKMYGISVTVPVHPSKAVKAAEDHKKVAEKEAAVRKEKAAVLAAKKQAENELADQKLAAEEAARQAKIKREYDRILQSAPLVKEERQLPLSVAMRPGVVPVAVKSGPVVPGAAPRMASSSSNEPFRVSASALLEHANEVHQDRLKEINASIFEEKEALKVKRERLSRLALEDYKRVKLTIMESLPKMSQCTLCQATFKIATAQCISEGCTTNICSKCLESKVEDDHRCVVCEDQHKHHNVIQNSKCPLCIAKMKDRKGYFQFDYCRADCGFICPDHSVQKECCVCGYQSYCQDCQVGTCDRCGDNLCFRCSYKEGCMCAERGGRSSFDLDDYL
jgi:hypothetical protein